MNPIAGGDVNESDVVLKVVLVVFIGFVKEGVSPGSQTNEKFSNIGQNNCITTTDDVNRWVNIRNRFCIEWPNHSNVINEGCDEVI
jgi:hypothetical protein